MKSHYFILLPLLLIFSCKTTPPKTTKDTLNYAWENKTCKHGDLEYLSPNYIEPKKEYEKALKEVEKSHTQCFCKTPPSNLPGLNQTDSPTTENKTNYIAPIFLDASSCNGLYSFRSLDSTNRYSVMKYKRGNPHYLFLISNGVYYELTPDNEALNKELFEREKENLLVYFTEEEFNKMVLFGINGIVWGDFIHYPPMLVKKETQVIYDLNIPQTE
jgi:hypothetical protein